MKTEEIRYWLKLQSTEFVGHKTFNVIYHMLKEEGKEISYFFEMDKEKIESMLEHKRIRHGKEIANSLSKEKGNFQKIDQIISRLSEKRIDIITLEDKKYPTKLKETLTDSTPPILYAFGNVSLLETSSVAIAGKREATTKATEISQQVASSLADNGFNIVSGYAKGIDTAAHLGALKQGGTTTIVLPFGILSFSWKKEFENFRERNSSILIISEFFPTIKWQVPLAMQRNNTIVGLSDVVFAAEFSEGGGTRDTMRKALRSGKQVFVPDTVANRHLLGKEEKDVFFVQLQYSEKGKCVLDVSAILNAASKTKTPKYNERYEQPILLSDDENSYRKTK